MSKSGEVKHVNDPMEGRCQDCKFHKNNPSKCAFYGFVSRKSVGCPDWRRK